MTDPRHPKDMKIKVFADGADLDGIRDMAGNALIEGFTTNPTLMRKAGISDYKGFALDVLKIVTERPRNVVRAAETVRGQFTAPCAWPRAPTSDPPH